MQHLLKKKESNVYWSFEQICLMYPENSIVANAFFFIMVLIQLMQIDKTKLNYWMLFSLKLRDTGV